MNNQGKCRFAMCRTLGYEIHVVSCQGWINESLPVLGEGPVTDFFQRMILVVQNLFKETH